MLSRWFVPFALYIILKRRWGAPPRASHPSPRRARSKPALNMQHCTGCPCAKRVRVRGGLTVPAFIRTQGTNTQYQRCLFSCPSFCLALSSSGRDEMFGQARWQLYILAAGFDIVCSYCMAKFVVFLLQALCSNEWEVVVWCVFEQSCHGFPNAGVSFDYHLRCPVMVFLRQVHHVYVFWTALEVAWSASWNVYAVFSNLS